MKEFDDEEYIRIDHVDQLINRMPNEHYRWDQKCIFMFSLRIGGGSKGEFRHLLAFPCTTKIEVEYNEIPRLFESTFTVKLKGAVEDMEFFCRKIQPYFN